MFMLIARRVEMEAFVLLNKPRPHESPSPSEGNPTPTSSLLPIQAGSGHNSEKP